MTELPNLGECEREGWLSAETIAGLEELHPDGDAGRRADIGESFIRHVDAARRHADRKVAEEIFGDSV
jgi:hypothetical protein